MEEELHMIVKYNMWLLVDKPQDKKVSEVRRLFQTKINADGLINKHKVRLVVKVYAQVFKLD